MRIIKQEKIMWYKPINESLLVFPDRIEENIRRMIAIAGDVQRLRPHVKTHKMAEVVRLQVQHGISKFKCATLAEVALVAASGGGDILLAYPLFGPAIQNFLDLVKQYPDVVFAVCVDSIEGCGQLAHQAESNGIKLRVFLDLDNGMHRTGIEPSQAGELVDFILDKRFLSLGGFHIYDGHIHDPMLEDRKEHCDRDFESVSSLVRGLEEKGMAIEELACGGTPTFPIHAHYKSRTLCPGTTLLWDAGYASSFPDLDFLPAAVLAGRVISKPLQNICLDLGHKSVASEMPHPRLKFLNLEVSSVENHSEEHLVLSSVDSDELAPGDLVYALPTHICPTIALHEQVYVVKDGTVCETWKVVARNRKYQ
jgi:D-serine deaminase-like pyridoxal phosphate-dependent protein